MRYLIPLALALAGCSPAPVPVVREPAEVIEFAAVAVIDCDELIRVVFLSSYGRAESVKVESAAHLLDTQLRLATIPYERVYYVINERPCGFRMDDEEPA